MCPHTESTKRSFWFQSCGLGKGHRRKQNRPSQRADGFPSWAHEVRLLPSLTTKMKAHCLNQEEWCQQLRAGPGRLDTAKARAKSRTKEKPEDWPPEHTAASESSVQGDQVHLPWSRSTAQSAIGEAGRGHLRPSAQAAVLNNKGRKKTETPVALCLPSSSALTAKAAKPVLTRHSARPRKPSVHGAASLGGTAVYPHLQTCFSDSSKTCMSTCQGRVETYWCCFTICLYQIFLFKTTRVFFPFEEHVAFRILKKSFAVLLKDFYLNRLFLVAMRWNPFPQFFPCGQHWLTTQVLDTL